MKKGCLALLVILMIPFWANAQCGVNINTQPLSYSGYIGDNYAVFVEVPEPWAMFQWYKDGVPLPGGNSATYMVNAIDPSASGNYWVEVSDGCSNIETSMSVNLFFACLPMMWQMPDQIHDRKFGESISLDVTALGSGPGTYQWEKDGQPVFSSSSPYYNISSAMPADEGVYNITYTDICSNVINTTLTLNLSCSTLYIVDHPLDEDTWIGGSVYMYVYAEGSGLDYTWRRNGVVMPGQKGSDLYFNPVTAANAGDYEVTITDPCGGEVVSNIATVTVSPFGPPDSRGGSLLAGAIQAGNVLGTGAAARMRGPQDIVFDSGTNFYYVTDCFNHQIKRISTTGTVTLLAGSGSKGFADGAATAARFSYPAGLDIDTENGLLYVADMGNNRIRVVDLNTNQVTTLAGSGQASYLEGVGTQADFKGPTDVAYDYVTGGAVYVVDNGNNLIRKILLADSTTSLLAGNPTKFGLGYVDAVGSAAKFNNPWHISLANDGLDSPEMMVTDRNNHAIRLVKADGTVTTEVGNGTPGFVDGGPSEVRLNKPTGIYYDGFGLYFTDHNNRCVRQKIEGNVATLSGNPTPGTVVGSRTRYVAPLGITVGHNGYLFMVDGGLHQIRAVEN